MSFFFPLPDCYGASVAGLGVLGIGAMILSAVFDTCGMGARLLAGKFRLLLLYIICVPGVIGVLALCINYGSPVITLLALVAEDAPLAGFIDGPWEVSSTD